MDYANEAFVKHYTRETEDWAVLTYDARAVELHCQRICDRSGVIATRRGAIGIAALIRAPIDRVEPAVSELLAEGRLQVHPAGYLIPWWLEAQEARQSDKARQRTSRARRRAGVTEADADVTNRDTDDASSHATSRDVTIDQRDQIREKEDPARELAVVACETINGIAGKRYDADSERTLKDCRKLAKAKIAPAQLRAAILHVGRPWLGTPFVDKIRPQTLLQLDRVRAALDDIQAGGRAPAQGRLAAIAAPTADHIVLDDGSIVERRAS